MAYGARLESVLGESPRGFESPILRHKLIGLTWASERARNPQTLGERWPLKLISFTLCLMVKFPV